MISNLERSFILKALCSGVRLDERTLNSFRDTSFLFHPTQRGHVTVHLGQTKVLAVTTATIIRPYVDRPAEGTINYFVDLTALALLESDEQEEGRLQRLLERVLKNSRVVDTESLCVVPGERVWSVRVDIRVIDHDGALLDASVAAAVASLVDFRRPEVTVTEDGVTVHSEFERNPVPLALHNPAIAVSFAVLDPAEEETDHATKQQSKVVPVVDPVWMEEQCGGGRLSMAINRNGEVVMLVKTGGEALDMETIQTDCLYVARQRAVHILDAINAAIVKARGK
ncbi:hypothetical protein PSACC_00655 [Paramicrosporidium saccamoebae]|uniref:Uncharacterized protein n=1 Tax=Paramicrosporidium saccamoebae TaxID=1246581 RepID=A0A2H9TP71_9FUNG|nr:hypothetical protein PSACC_00655 [Paramicrosporidium saccamoebae]